MSQLFFLQLKNLLVEGVRAGRTGWVEAALASGANTDIQLAVDDVTAPNGSLLALAAALGYDHLVPILLDAGVDVDDGGELGYTPLQVAVHKGYDRVVDALMKAQPKRPNVNAQDVDGKFFQYSFANFLICMKLKRICLFPMRETEIRSWHQ